AGHRSSRVHGGEYREGRRVDPSGVTPKHERRALARGRVPRRDDEVGEAVAVEIGRLGDRVPELTARAGGRRSGNGDTRGRPAAADTPYAPTTTSPNPSPFTSPALEIDPKRVPPISVVAGVGGRPVAPPGNTTAVVARSAPTPRSAKPSPLTSMMDP